MKEKRWIVDTTLRDGEQQAKLALSTKDKLEIALLLDDIGVHEIEAGIATQGMMEKEYIEELMRQRKSSKISVWSRANPSDIECAISCKPDIIHIGMPISYIQIYTKLKKNKVWVEKSLKECIELIHKEGIDVTVGFEDASRADVGYMMHLAKMVKGMGVGTVRIADTVGVLTPSRMQSIVKEIIYQVDIDIEAHVHNDLGMVVASTIAGAKAGAKYLDCTLGGIGERSGNCNLFQLLQVGERLFDLNIDKGKVKIAEEKLNDLLKAR